MSGIGNFGVSLVSIFGLGAGKAGELRYDGYYEYKNQTFQCILRFYDNGTVLGYEIGDDVCRSDDIIKKVLSTGQALSDTDFLERSEYKVNGSQLSIRDSGEDADVFAEEFGGDIMETKIIMNTHFNGKKTNDFVFHPVAW